MKINIAKSAGFCFGVKRAINIALDTASIGKQVYMLGDIVHNETVVNSIRERGIKKIARLGNGKNKILLIRAHGASKRLISKAKKQGYGIVDATCPMVKEIHRIARSMEKKCGRIIVIGDKKHDEVLGIIGQLKKPAVVIDDLKRMPLARIKRLSRACVVVQSTQNSEKVMRIVEILKRHIKKLIFFNTICKPTRLKQEEIKRMPLENDLMLIIGSKNSANTKRLYEISKSLNKNSYWVNSCCDIRKDWFRRAKSVGLTAGASTPKAIIQEIIKYLSSIG